MAIKVTRIRKRPNIDVNFSLQENDSVENKFVDYEEKMLEDGKIISINVEISDDELEVQKTYIFNDVQSLFDYFFFKNKDLELIQSDYNNDMHQITNNITTKFVIDWNYAQ
jgi:hypothetical protein